MRPFVVVCDSQGSTDWLLDWLRRGGYGKKSPGFATFADDYPAWYCVLVADNGNQINTRADVANLLPLCKVHDKRTDPIIYNSLHHFTTSNRNTMITGESRVHSFLPVPRPKA